MQHTIKLARFDATLRSVISLETMLFNDWMGKRPNAVLTLTLRLGFKQINPAGGAETGTYHDYGKTDKPERDILKWTDAAWSTWKKDFVESASKFWSNKFCLVNQHGHFPYELDGKVMIPNVRCKLKIVPQDASATDNHHAIDVVRLAEHEKFFGSHARLYDSKDTKETRKGSDSAGKKIMQKAHVHEVGHLMGLGHVDIGKAHCPASGDTNESACYGVADKDLKSVMGRGMELRESHAQPWQTAIKKFETWAKVHPSYSALNARVTKAGIGIGPLRTWPPHFFFYHARTMEEVKAHTLNFGMLEPA